MPRALLIGSRGNMGKRYLAIFKHLGVSCVGVDKGDLLKIEKGITHIMIATPTDTHFELLKYLRDCKLPVLCEKPITKNLDELSEILSWGMNLSMVNQYQEIAKSGPGDTSYDYFRTGNDGLNWDCMNVIGLAQGKITKIANQSPIWKCTINGTRLSLANMDQAYVRHIQGWLTRKSTDTSYIVRAHERASKWPIS